MNICSSTLVAFMSALAGCSAASADRATPTATAAWTSYTCSDRQVVQAAYPDANTAWVKIKGETHTLHITMSASGARYIGDNWQWWTKGMHDGMLAPLAAAETIASAPGVSCHAG
jgi:membrane-bound inhibitor of C-type lysozyme